MRTSSSASSPWDRPVTTTKSESVQRAPLMQECSPSSTHDPTCSTCPGVPLYDVTSGNRPFSGHAALTDGGVHLSQAGPHVAKDDQMQRAQSNALNDFGIALSALTPDQTARLLADVSRSAPQMKSSLATLLDTLHPHPAPAGPVSRLPFAPRPLPLAIGSLAHGPSAYPGPSSSIVFAEQAHVRAAGGAPSIASTSLADEEPILLLPDGQLAPRNKEAVSSIVRREQQIRKDLHKQEWVALMDPKSRDAWATERFYFLQQNPCKEFAVNLIRSIDPAKQANIPYRNKKAPSRRPPYWPDDPEVRHDVTPSHLKKEERVKLLVHFLFLPDNNAEYYALWREAQPSNAGHVRTWADMIQDVANATTFGTNGPRRFKERSRKRRKRSPKEEDVEDEKGVEEAMRIQDRLQIMHHLIFASHEVEKQAGSGWSTIKTKLPALPNTFFERLVAQHMRIRKDRPPPKGVMSAKRKRRSVESGATVDDHPEDEDEDEDENDDDGQSMSSAYVPGYIAIPSDDNTDTASSDRLAYQAGETPDVEASAPNPIKFTEESDSSSSPPGSQVVPMSYANLAAYDSFQALQTPHGGPRALDSGLEEMATLTQPSGPVHHLNPTTTYGFPSSFQSAPFPQYEAMDHTELSQGNMAYQMQHHRGFDPSNPSLMGMAAPATNIASDYDQTAIVSSAGQSFVPSQYNSFTQSMYMVPNYEDPDEPYTSFGRPEY